jgi:hypothetical protein
VNHCFDYLRQALQCAGDLALEWPRTEKDGRRYSVDGWGVPHLCKSWVCDIIYVSFLFESRYFENLSSLENWRRGDHGLTRAKTKNRIRLWSIWISTISTHQNGLISQGNKNHSSF